MAFNPVHAAKEITDDYLRYLSSVFSIHDPEYQHQFSEQLKHRDVFYKGPYLEVTDAFVKGPSIRQLITEGKLPEEFEKLGFHLDRPLYQHQADALNVAASGRNLVVSTGTGSGKTESFLIPILDYILREKEQVGYLKPGVRALIIYPMNALANDQMERMRELLKDTPEITFGSYTGQTLEKPAEALEEYRNLNGGRAPLPNELISRSAMKEKPPHILITNYAMLEYLMIRPDDSVFFLPANTEHWNYIVMDEAHIYSGTTGIEVSFLLRRLNATLKRPNMQYILTSATLGGKDDNGAVAEFGTNLCSSKFLAKDVIRAKRVKFVQPEQLRVLSSLEYHKLAAVLDEENLPAANGILSELLSCDISAIGLGEALYQLLYYEKRYWDMRRALSHGPAPIQRLAAQLNLTVDEITDFVTVATKAVHDGGKLFDARYHHFLRATESVYITLPPHKRLFLTGKKTHEENGQVYKVFEIATCKHCHAIYLLGKETKNHILEQDNTNDMQEPSFAYLLGKRVYDSDDEHILEDEGIEHEPYEVCSICGSLNHAGGAHYCQHGPENFVAVQKIKLKEGTQRLVKCPSCENTDGQSGILRRFFAGQEASTSVIATSLFEEIPSQSISYQGTVETEEDDYGFGDEDQESQQIIKKAEAKQFIAFSDNRQAAAFFASYLDLSYRNILYKRLLMEAMDQLKSGGVMTVPITQFVIGVQEQFNKYHIVDTAFEKKEAWKAVLHELYDNNGVTSLFNFGGLSIDVSPSVAKRYKGLHLEEEEVRGICALFLRWMLSEGTASYEKYQTMTADDREFFTHNGVECSYTLSDADSKKGRKSFLPSREGLSNKRLEYMKKVLNLDQSLQYTEEDLVQFMERLWNAFFTKVGVGFLTTSGNGTYKIDLTKVNIRVPPRIYRCKKCRKLAAWNVRGVCPVYHCDGQLEEIDLDAELKNDHYYRIYHDMEIRPMRVVEHTAQLDRNTAYEYQLQFKNKKLDILSCSTTFEMGVDVGSLETVFMRNMPPSPANYAQRAGRAGRSLDSAAFALTFCNKANHDFSYFRNPEDMIVGRINPPQFNTNNDKIAIRHLYASVFGYFWKCYPGYFRHAETMISAGESGKTGIEQMVEYLEARPKDLRDFLKLFLPPALAEKFQVAAFGWVPSLIDPDEGKLIHAETVYHESVDALEAARQDAIARNVNSDMFLQRIKVYQHEPILTFLSRNNILPKYGFPVDTVELTVSASRFSKGLGLQLQRDLSMAISEYAPGSQIVADNHLITSRYIRKMPSMLWKMARYNRCQNCNSLNIKPYLGENDSPYSSCEVCGSPLGAVGKIYLIPEFGFQADPNSIVKPGLRRPIHTYRGEVSYIGKPDREPPVEVPVGKSVVEMAVNSAEELAVINDSNFFVCENCGYTELQPKLFQTYYNFRNQHRSPSGKLCKNKCLKRYSLCYRYETDVVTLRFPECDLSSYDRALSLLYGILEGMSHRLTIDRSDINGTLTWSYDSCWRSGQYILVLFDSAPGGAGHVRQLAKKDNLCQVLKETLSIMESCTCGGEHGDDSCYGCLRNYRNQKHHDQLKRGYVIDILHEILG